mgnify:CR=1 FL=1
MDTNTMANILYNMNLDMDYMDAEEYWEIEMHIMAKEIEKLKENHNMLYYALTNICITNQNYFNLFAKV